MTDSLPHKFVLVTNEVTGANTTRLYGAAFDSGGNVIAASQDLGLNVVHPADPAIDSDGCRFAMSFTHEYNPQPLDTDLAAVTLAVVGNQILVQDLDVPGGSLELEAHGSICAVHSGGGGLNTYGVAWGYDSGANTFAVQARRYAGTGDGITSFRLTGCGGLNLSVTGIARLGDTIAFALTNAQGLAGFVAGAPISQPLGFCPGCTQGVSGSAVLGAQLSIPVPLNPAMVGSVIAFQGFDFGNGPCLGQIALSNTADVEVR
ncbi:MAG TPA: hypothetical protein VK348_15160, partial [Planctomycetota bacterium]|nr:hypothetical protein [Planctomycetota bacterium]